MVRGAKYQLDTSRPDGVALEVFVFSKSTFVAVCALQIIGALITYFVAFALFDDFMITLLAIAFVAGPLALPILFVVKFGSTKRLFLFNQDTVQTTKPNPVRFERWGCYLCRFVDGSRLVLKPDGADEFHRQLHRVGVDLKKQTQT